MLRAELLADKHIGQRVGLTMGHVAAADLSAVVGRYRGGRRPGLAVELGDESTRAEVGQRMVIDDHYRAVVTGHDVRSPVPVVVVTEMQRVGPVHAVR